MQYIYTVSYYKYVCIYEAFGMHAAITTGPTCIVQVLLHLFMTLCVSKRVWCGIPHPLFSNNYILYNREIIL